jgi:hypothetical protein
LSPVVVGQVDTPHLANGVAVAGSFGYVADFDAGLQVIDVKNPATPVIVGAVDTPGSARAVAVGGGFAYVADGGAGLQVIDVTNPVSPVVVGQVDTPGLAVGIALAGSYAYVADNFTGLQVIDVTNPASPVIVGKVDTPYYPQGIAVAGSHAYVADFSGVQVIDVTNPANPVIVGGTGTPGHAEDVAVAGSYAYVADDGAGLQILPTQCLAPVSVPLAEGVIAAMTLRALPNPSFGQTVIQFATREGGTIQANVYDPTGRLVRRLGDRWLHAGIHELLWNGRNDSGREVAAGSYLVRIVTQSGLRASQRITLLR